MSTGDFDTEYDGTVVKFRHVGVPPEVQARYDALPEARKAALAAEFEEAVDELFAKFGIARRK